MYHSNNNSRGKLHVLKGLWNVSDTPFQEDKEHGYDLSK